MNMLSSELYTALKTENEKEIKVICQPHINFQRSLLSDTASLNTEILNKDLLISSDFTANGPSHLLYPYLREVDNRISSKTFSFFFWGGEEGGLGYLDTNNAIGDRYPVDKK